MIQTRLEGGPALPVGKILAVGRNYLAHALEMGTRRPLEPLLFLKPPTALLPGGGSLHLPPFSQEVHFEVEMVVRLGGGGKELDPEAAGKLVDGVAVGLDLTARDLQRRAKELGEPWAVAKGFDGSAPISSLRPVADVALLSDLPLTLERNKALCQCARTNAMLWSVPELLAFASTRFTLEAGDLFFTGTPAGVGPVQAGDQLCARLGEELKLDLHLL